ncbi:hypothetical protein HDU76_010039 [Blyttiomyces sp. JEL0837]|nr:hypothetical protein HDU76_010039 [Blyttiomyces sp. JEL0837]
MKQQRQIHDVVFSEGFQNESEKILARLKKMDTGKTTTISRNLFDMTADQPPSGPEYKYFEEAGIAELGTAGRHLDGRYGKDRTYYTDKQLRVDTLIEMLQAWNEFQKENGIVTWMAHGPLIGWFWNGDMLPWDTDIDVQIAYQHLIALQPLNQTVYQRRYLFDINPFFKNRTILPTGNHNVIDARFVDMNSGYYIDITALSFSNSDWKNLSDYALASYGPYSTATTKSLYSKDQQEEEQEPIPNLKDWMSCKSPHYYRYETLFPLYETTLNGVKIWRPNNILEILGNEYSERSMIRRYFDTHEDQTRYRWVYIDDAVDETTGLKKKGEWVMKSAKRIDNGNLGHNKLGLGRGRGF